MKKPRAQGERFLTPDFLRRLEHLSVASRFRVEGSRTGSHRSPLKGLSTEFADHRQYVIGDDLKRLDWKVYARNERYYVKQYEESTNLRAYLMVDRSASMKFGSNGQSKFEYACQLAAGLAYVITKQQDNAGLVLFSRKIDQYIPPGSSALHLRAMLDALAETEPSDRTEAATALHGAADRIHRRGLIFVLSDLLDDQDAVMRGLAHFRQKQHDVIVFHILDDAELNLPYDQITTFRDMETGDQIRVSPRDMKRDYADRIASFIQSYRKACFDSNIDYAQINTATPCATFLAAYLNQRTRTR